MNPILEMNRLAGAAIAPNSIVKMGADDDHVIVGAAAADALIGVVDQPRVSAAAEDRVDVIVVGIADVKLGGAVTRGDLITAGAGGVGVAAAPAAGTNNGVVGRALKSGVTGDIIPVLVVPSQVQG